MKFIFEGDLLTFIQILIHIIVLGFNHLFRTFTMSLFNIQTLSTIFHHLQSFLK